jgi:hypothetical protein
MVNRSRTMADVGGVAGTRKQDNSSSSTYTDGMRAYFATAHDTGLSHLDFITGQPLDPQTLANDTPMRRKHFYT